ncbi:hypothetical protein ACU4GD_21670 [Cupriavidus basilensis]
MARSNREAPAEMGSRSLRSSGTAIFTPRVADAHLHDYPLPGVSISFLPGFENEGAGEALDRCITAHLNAFAVKHEHKMAAVGYMISKICKVTVV